MSEQQVRNALRGLAESSGAPDERTAWEAIRTRVDRDDRRAVRLLVAEPRRRPPASPPGCSSSL